MSLKDRLANDLKDAMKSRDAVRVETIRLLRAKIMESEIAKSRDLTEDETIGLFTTAIKQRNEAIALYEKGDRAELAAKEAAEKAVIESYLPTPLSTDELKALIAAAIAETQATSIKQMGAVMNLVMARSKGRADGKTVNQLVREALQG